MALVGQAVAANSEHIRPIAPDVRRIVSYLDWDKTPAGERQFSTGHCFILPTDGSPDDRADHLACVTPQAGQRHVMLVGDSHAAQLSQALREALAKAPRLPNCCSDGGGVSPADRGAGSAALSPHPCARLCSGGGASRR
jgi:hypothetical protein